MGNLTLIKHIFRCRSTKLVGFFLFYSCKRFLSVLNSHRKQSIWWIHVPFIKYTFIFKMFWIRPVLQNSPADNNDKRGKNKTGTNIFSIYSILNLVIDQINIHWQTVRSCWYKVLKPIVTYPYNNEISKNFGNIADKSTHMRFSCTITRNLFDRILSVN